MSDLIQVLDQYPDLPVLRLYFAGLPETCTLIERTYPKRVVTFGGAESLRESLGRLNIVPEALPQEFTEGSRYDEALLDFGRELIASGEAEQLKPLTQMTYPEAGTKQDTLLLRRQAVPPEIPLIRAHVGPYDALKNRIENVADFETWTRRLAKGGWLDILSIGSSQLTQSRFNEDWGNVSNGGGVPIATPDEYRRIKEAAGSMLVRTYAGTRNVPELADMHEDTLNIAWHALSFWWFNVLDERGPNPLCQNLYEHTEALKRIARTNKPFEPNIPHHFAFRGADDVTYIVSAYLSAVLAKKLGIRTFILQVMLNTPRPTWGLQDLAKVRTLLEWVRRLEDENFRVMLQPRAGLDYFKPDLKEAEIQLAAVSALMDDIEPDDPTSPPILHVVSASEALHLADPDTIEASIRITHAALIRYRRLKAEGKLADIRDEAAIRARQEKLRTDAKQLIEAIEKYVKDPYSPEGFYRIFAAGFLPVPYLWKETERFKAAVHWQSRMEQGGVILCDASGTPVSMAERIAYALSRIPEAERLLKEEQAQLKTDRY